MCNTVGMPCTKAVCGNSITEADEGCDDGNTVYGDGCSGACQNEPTFTVGGVLNAKCGDGILTPSTGEVCDDGNTKTGDGCDAACRQARGGLPVHQRGGLAGFHLARGHVSRRER